MNAPHTLKDPAPAGLDCPPSSRRTRVLYVDHTASLGGGEIALLNLLRHLDRDRFHPIVLLFSDGPLACELRRANVETHILPLAANVLGARKDALGIATLVRVSVIARALAHVGRVARFIQRHRIDLVHTNSLKADIIGGLAARLARRRVIWHVRDRIDADYLPAPVVTTFRLLARRLPTSVIANSHATLRTLKLDARACVVHDGTRCPMPPPSQATAHAPDPQRSSGQLIGLVGRISPWKGQHIFLKAAAALRMRFPHARFQIIGAPLFSEREYDAEIRALSSRLGLNDVIEFTGFRPDVADLIERLDILVHASTLGEPFGQVIIEGMAAGKPVVATNGGGVPEIVVHGQTGLLVPMGDPDAMAQAISQLLTDSAASSEMGRRGRQRVRDCFTIQRTTREVERVYGQFDRFRSIR